MIACLLDASAVGACQVLVRYVCRRIFSSSTRCSLRVEVSIDSCAASSPSIKTRSTPWHSQDCLFTSLRGEFHLAVDACTCYFPIESNIHSFRGILIMYSINRSLMLVTAPSGSAQGCSSMMAAGGNAKYNQKLAGQLK